MIDQSKTYRTRAGDAVRIYATDCGGYYPIHGAIKYGDGWTSAVWAENGCFCVNRVTQLDRDLIEADPHGILPRHRELLAEEFQRGLTQSSFSPSIWAESARTLKFGDMQPPIQAALIALAKLDNERGGV